MSPSRLLETFILCASIYVAVLIVRVASVPTDCINTGQCVFEKHLCDSTFKTEIERLTPLFNKGYSVTVEEVGGDVITFSAGICIPAENTSSRGSSNITTAGVIQITNHKDSQTTEVHVMGSIKAAQIKAGRNWMELVYEDGDKYNTHCGGENRRAVIMIVCAPGDQKGTFVMVNEYNEKSEDCMYLFELGHDAACDVHTTTGLSVGSIICIIFFSVVAVYLLGGFVYQRFVVGAKGMEQLPHIAFWQDFGNLQADGCDLIFRRGSKTAGSRQYRGVGDDQLTPREESEPDDHLLPM